MIHLQYGGVKPQGCSGAHIKVVPAESFGHTAAKGRTGLPNENALPYHDNCSSQLGFCSYAFKELLLLIYCHRDTVIPVSSFGENVNLDPLHGERPEDRGVRHHRWTQQRRLRRGSLR